MKGLTEQSNTHNAVHALLHVVHCMHLRQQVHPPVLQEKSDFLAPTRMAFDASQRSPHASSRKFKLCWLWDMRAIAKLAFQTRKERLLRKLCLQGKGPLLGAHHEGLIARDEHPRQLQLPLEVQD